MGILTRCLGHRAHSDWESCRPVISRSCCHLPACRVVANIKGPVNVCIMCAEVPAVLARSCHRQLVARAEPLVMDDDPTLSPATCDDARNMPRLEIVNSAWLESGKAATGSNLQQKPHS